MPELPEVENVARGLKPLEGLVLQRLETFDPRVWFECKVGPESFLGRKLVAVTRRGKYLILRFEGGFAFIQHLRMTGKMIEFHSPALPELIRAQIGTKGPKAVQVRCRFSFGEKEIVFYDTRRFGTISAVEDEEEFFSRKKIAPDPFHEAEIARRHFLAGVSRRARPAKAALLDQSLIAGVGNIYADEALFAIGADPRTPAARLKEPEKLWLAIREILAASMAKGGSSIVNYVGADGLPGKFSDELKVYGRAGEPCLGCGKSISKIQLAGRSTHFCSACQKRRR
jgi:formamidopyrimidine-DNA glycosylase